jgi:hypothetical protein
VTVWLLFPALLLAVCLGCGLLVDRAAGGATPGVLLPSLGLALVIVAASLITRVDGLAHLAPILVLLLAVAGYASSWRRVRALRPDGWTAAVGAAVFAVFAAPVVLSGQATFLGYFFLNDTAFQFVLVDQLIGHGHDLSRLHPGAFETIARTYLRSEYPVGAQLAAGAIRPLGGWDIAWVFQPYLATVMALLGVTLYRLLDGVVVSRRLRALAAFLAAQPGLVYAYYAEASVKELATLWIAAVMALAVASAGRRIGWRSAIPIALLLAAGIYVLNVAILAWIGIPLAAFAVMLLWQRRGTWSWRGVVVAAGGAVVAVALAYPALEGVRTFFAAAKSVLTAQGELGNLVAPLNWWQGTGVWPMGDFRFAPNTHQQLGFAVMGIALAAAGLGLLWLLRRRPLGPSLFVASLLIALIVLTRRGSPWANAKTLMIASSAVVLTAMFGVVALRQAGRRLESWALAGTIAAGVLWTNALVYRDVNLAPRGRLTNLARVAKHLGGRGPVWLDEHDEFAAHFMRGLAVSNSPMAPPPLRADLPALPSYLTEFPWDVNEVDPGYLQRFQLIVLRRSPIASLPPADFRPAGGNRDYAVWQRGGTPASTVLVHVPLGGIRRTQAGTVAPCGALRRVAARATAQRARLAYVERPALPAFIPVRGRHNPRWVSLPGGDPLSLHPGGGGGRIAGSIDVAVAGRYRLWVQGTFDRRWRIEIDGRSVGSVADALGPQGQFLNVGTTAVAAGRHRIAVVRTATTLAPGIDGTTRLLGPVVLDPVSDQPTVRYLAPREIASLCGKRLAWLEIVR